MPQQTETALDALTSLVADADQHAARVAALKLTDNQKREFAQKEMKDNVWPWLADFGRAVVAQIEDHEEALEEILETETSVIQPELAAQIFLFIQQGRELLAKLRTLKLSDVTKKDLYKMLDLFEKNAAVVETAVNEVAVELEPGDGDTDEPEESEEDADEDAGDGDDEPDVTDDTVAPLDDEPTKPGEVA